jgi:hypothetical protein
LNVDVGRRVLIGVEERYVRADPPFGGQKITLNETEYALNGFELNGLTTTAALSCRFRPRNACTATVVRRARAARRFQA